MPYSSSLYSRTSASRNYVSRRTDGAGRDRKVRPPARVSPRPRGVEPPAHRGHRGRSSDRTRVIPRYSSLIESGAAVRPGRGAPRLRRHLHADLVSPRPVALGAVAGLSRAVRETGRGEPCRGIDARGRGARGGPGGDALPSVPVQSCVAAVETVARRRRDRPLVSRGVPRLPPGGRSGRWTQPRSVAGPAR